MLVKNLKFPLNYIPRLQLHWKVIYGCVTIKTKLLHNISNFSEIAKIHFIFFLLNFFFLLHTITTSKKNSFIIKIFNVIKCSYKFKSYKWNMSFNILLFPPGRSRVTLLVYIYMLYILRSEKKWKKGQKAVECYKFFYCFYTVLERSRDLRASSSCFIDWYIFVI